MVMVMVMLMMVKMVIMGMLRILMTMKVVMMVKMVFMVVLLLLIVMMVMRESGVSLTFLPLAHTLVGTLSRSEKVKVQAGKKRWK